MLRQEFLGPITLVYMTSLATAAEHTNRRLTRYYFPLYLLEDPWVERKTLVVQLFPHYLAVYVAVSVRGCSLAVLAHDDHRHEGLRQD